MVLSMMDVKNNFGGGITSKAKAQNPKQHFKKNTSFEFQAADH